MAEHLVGALVQHRLLARAGVGVRKQRLQVGTEQALGAGAESLLYRRAQVSRELAATFPLLALR
jgi:hypothetical protein